MQLFIVRGRPGWLIDLHLLERLGVTFEFHLR